MAVAVAVAGGDDREVHGAGRLTSAKPVHQPKPVKKRAREKKKNGSYW